VLFVDLDRISPAKGDMRPGFASQMGKVAPFAAAASRDLLAAGSPAWLAV